MSLLALAGTNSATGGYDIDNSLKFEIDNSECLTKTFGSSGNRKAWTWSSWVKRTELNSSTTYQLLFSAGTGNPPRDVFFFDDDTDDTLCFFSNGGLFSSTTLGFRTNAVFRDTSAWYHIVLVLDTANSTAADRLKLYVNGVSQTFSTYNAPTQNADSLINSNTAHAIGRDSSFAALGFDAQYFSGYMAETHFVDGSALAPTEFGEFDEDSGIWKPKAYTGTFGSNGFYLDFADASDLGDDESGNGNDFTEVNITAADQAVDTPTNNFATWNVAVDNAGIFSYTEGATKWKPTSGNWASTTASLGFTKGKWYAEFKAASNVTNVMVGVQELSGNYVGGYSGEFANSTSEGYGYYNANGNVYNNGGNSSYGASFPLSVLVGVALDFKDDGTALMYISKDNVWQNSADPANGTGGYSLNSGSAVEGFFSFAGSLFTSADYLQANFGGYTVNTISSAASDENGYGTFEYAPPSGYYALCTKNLAEYG
jgi:hypothetical protein